MTWTPPGFIPPAPRAPPPPIRSNRRGAINPRQIPQAPVLPINVSQEIQDILVNMRAPGGQHHRQLEQVIIVDDFEDEEIIDLERGQNRPRVEGEE
jgi:hypothetical protein